MINSMTGFGGGTAEANDIRASVEIRSVNKRHIDISLRAPDALGPLEVRMQKQVQDAFERGRFKVNVEVERAEGDALHIDVDTEAALRYKDALDRLRSATQIQEPVRIEHLLQFEDLFSKEESKGIDAEAAWPAVQEALATALDALATMRAQEGKALYNDLSANIDAIDQGLQVVEARAPERVVEHQERLRDRLAELIDDDRVDDDRIETEVAILADKLNINEECVRLRSHLTMFREALDGDEPAGRKLKFITQEIHREINTIGAKANDPNVSTRVVAMKEDVEKIREQIENVE